MNTNPVPQSNPLDLHGLEDLLDRAQLEVVDAGSLDAEKGDETSPIDDGVWERSPESAVVLDLLSHLLKVNDLLVETNQRLNIATNRLVELDECLTAQSVMLEKVPVLEAKAALVDELSERLQTAVTENERLSRTWVNRFSSFFQRSK